MPQQATPRLTPTSSLRKKLVHQLKSCLTRTRKGINQGSRHSISSTSSTEKANNAASTNTPLLVPSRPSSSSSYLRHNHLGVDIPSGHLHFHIPTTSHILPPPSPTPSLIAPTWECPLEEGEQYAALAHPFLMHVLSKTHPTALANGQITPLYHPDFLRLHVLVDIVATHTGDREQCIRLFGRLFAAPVIHEEVAEEVAEAVHALPGFMWEGEAGPESAVMNFEGVLDLTCDSSLCQFDRCRARETGDEELREDVVWQKEEKCVKKWGDAPTVEDSPSREPEPPVEDSPLSRPSLSEKEMKYREEQRQKIFMGMDVDCR